VKRTSNQKAFGFLPHKVPLSLNEKERLFPAKGTDGQEKHFPLYAGGCSMFPDKRESHFTLLTSKLREASGVHDYIKERTVKIGKYIVETKKTVRVIAKEFGVSKSTVHKDLTERLPEINPELANEVKKILNYHKSIRHLRGGEATKLKYKKAAERAQEQVARR
jgi:putative DeoR family transcriptional regulator (stage III sporulation protein D)